MSDVCERDNRYDEDKTIYGKLILEKFVAGVEVLKRGGYNYKYG